MIRNREDLRFYLKEDMSQYSLSFWKYIAYFFAIGVKNYTYGYMGICFDVAEDIKDNHVDTTNSFTDGIYEKIDITELPEDIRIALEDPFIEIELKRKCIQQGNIPMGDI